MAYIYENDVSKVGGNLQSTVAYLLSLHKNEYEWNMLGIKVVGHIDALPIPDGQYEYGDAYMVGTETPYEMYVYTRADAMHNVDYWFDIGKFPQPGPQGPAGSGLNDVIGMEIKGVDSVQYNSTDGATITYNESTLTSVDPNTHAKVVDDIDTLTVELPIRAGQYLSMDADSTDGMVEVKVDDTELSRAYIKQPVSTVNVSPVYTASTKQIDWKTATPDISANSIVLRDGSSNSKFSNIYCNEILRLSDGYQAGTATQLRYAVTTNADLTVAKTSTDTGTISVTNLALLQQFAQLHIVYNNQLYYRMDPLTAPDGTLNYIHIDSIQDDSGGYKATGKCFSITTATRAWQVVDIKFGSDVAGSNETYINTVNLYSANNVNINFTLTTPLPIAADTFFTKFYGCNVVGTHKNLAETSAEIRSAIISLQDSIIVQTGNNTYRYTNNQLTVTVQTTKVSQ